MSLINEALKKAGRDAALSSPRQTPTPTRSHLPRRRSSLGVTLVVAIVAIGLLFAVLRGSLRRDDGGARSVAEASTAETPSTAPISPEEATADPGIQPAVSPVELLESTPSDTTEPPIGTPSPLESAAAEDSALSIGPERPDEGGTTAGSSQDDSVAQEVPPPRRKRRQRAKRQEPATPPVAAPTRSTLDGGSFLKRVQVAGGKALELSGIAWSESQPAAVISGSVVSPGERIQGFRVIRINPDSVDLEGPNESFTLRLR